MTTPVYIYRKPYEHRFEAEGAAEGFHLFPGIDGRPEAPEVSVKEESGIFYVYVALAGEPDPEELFAATGYERVN